MKGCSDEETPYDLDFSGKSNVQKVYKNGKYYISALAPVQTDEPGWFLCAEEAKSDYMQTVTNIKTIIIIAIIIIITKTNCFTSAILLVKMEYGITHTSFQPV